MSIDHQQVAKKAVLPPVVPPREVIELEVYFVERSSQDPLLGESLWRELDQISGTSAALRAKLEQAGMRYGVAGKSPPSAVRALVAARDDSASAALTRFQKLALMSGQAGTLEAAVITTPFAVVTAGEGSRPREYQSARGILRLSGEQVQDGWVRLHFQPEFHHGPNIVRSVATEHDWQYQHSQEIDALYERSFDVKLNVGELVVVGAAGKAADSIGSRFFRSGEEPDARQRVMIVRVIGMQTVDPVRAK